MGDMWTDNTNYKPVGTGYKAGWGVIVGVVIVAYILGLVFFLPKQTAMERENRERKHDEIPELRQISPNSRGA